MTAPQWTRRRRFRAIVIVIVSLTVLGSSLLVLRRHDSSRLLQNDQKTATSYSHRRLRYHGIFTDEQANQNAHAVKQWRKEYENMCKNEVSTEEDLLHYLERVAKPSMIHEGTHEDSLLIEPCRQVFLDFGANVGDSLQKFISAGIPKCLDKMPNHHPSFNATTGSATQSFRGGNQLVSWSWNRMKDYSKLVYFPEDYCYFGIEGNPAFTSRLKVLERGVMRMDPRPVRRAHFFTETVGAGEDGPTTLYLDTINTDQNSWGSSLLSEHKDIQASAERNGGSRVEATVEGMTLETLLKQVVAKKRGAHVMIKMDIEGGEFAVLEQAAWDGTVCDLLKAGIKMDLILEAHNEQVTGTRTPQQQEAFKKAKDKLVKCGLNLWLVKDAGR